jgi:orotidine-5'-phosphate decarboxylase
MAEGFTERLGRAVAGGAAPAAVGLDPRIEALPRVLLPGGSPADRIVAFYEAVLPTIARHAPVVKPNIAFFERHGAAGYGAYETTCRLARECGLLVLGDVKRGDIGSTAEAYAVSHLGLADAVTVSPYLGSDAIEPFLQRCRADRRAIFVLVRTSNPSAADFQDLATADGRVCEVVADAVDRWGRDLVDAFGFSAVGAVVGATRPAELAGLRARMPRAWFLIPGVGIQGGRIADVGAAFDSRGLGGLVAQSRGVLQCFAPDATDWHARIDAALATFAEETRAVSGGST